MVHRSVKPHFVRKAVLVTACFVAGLFMIQCDGGSATFTKTPLPYALDALAPAISAQTMDLHYNKHYAGYVKNAIELSRRAPYSGKTPEEIIRMTANNPAQAALFNNAAQAWNHAFFFQSLKPEGGGAPEGRLAEMIAADFGGFKKFRKEMIAAATGHFGSGWVWLALKDDKLVICATHDADNPIAHDAIPLFGIDVWEHAYYLDYQNQRGDYVTAVLDHLVDWDFVAAQLPVPVEPEVPAESAE
ncbi:superoxide dismutase [Desulfosarcina sp. OttesenSCG-928-G10]|nr:superoxide dismutase [Desulfosarcina sp. OttesenSCG-928-G10]MDL2321272.1 superoxide dismutase [Desulfosarcina sp. OttesenSCG-928-B08]